MIRDIRERLNQGKITIGEIDELIKQLEEEKKNNCYDYTLLKDNEEIFEYENEAKAFERITGKTFDPDKYMIRQANGAYDDGYDNPINTISIWNKSLNEAAVKKVEELIEDLKKEKRRLSYTLLKDDEEIMEYESAAQAFERIMGIPFDPNKYEIRQGTGAYDDGYDNPINTISIWSKDPSITQADVDNKDEVEMPQEVEKPIVEDKEEIVNPYANITDEDLRNRIRDTWERVVNTSQGEVDANDPLLAEYDDLIAEDLRRRENAREEQQSVIEEPVIEEPVVEEPVVETPAKEEVAEEKPQWDPRLREDQILDALSRDIYEPVGPEYEQFLNELGLGDLSRNNETPDNTEDLSLSDEELDEARERIVEPTPDKEDTKEEEETPSEKTTEEMSDEELENLINRLNQERERLNRERDRRNSERNNNQGTVEPTPDKEQTEEQQPTEEKDKETEEPDKENKENKSTEPPIPPYKPDQKGTVVPPVPPVPDKDNEDRPTVDKPAEKEDDTKQEGRPSFRNWDIIVSELMNSGEKDEEDKEIPLDLSVRATKKITNGKISVTKAFADRCRQGNGNLTYKILGAVSGIPMAIITTATKLSGKLYGLFHPKAKATYAEYENRLNNLSKEDLEILLAGFTAHETTARRGQAALMPLIEKRLVNYIKEEYVEPLVDKISRLSFDIADRYDSLDILWDRYQEASKAGDLAAANKAKHDIAIVVDGSAKLVDEIQKSKSELSGYLEGSVKGIHGITECAKLTKNHAFDYARGFAKNISTGKAYEFTKESGMLQARIDEAIYDNNDLAALQNYGDLEQLKIKNTKETGILGKYSAGLFNWNLMPTEANYSNDPLFQYLFQTLAVVSLTKGIVDNIHNANVRKEIEQANSQNAGVNQQIDGVNARNAAADQANQATMEQIRATGRDLEGRSGDYAQGIEGMARQDIIGHRAVGEYNALDAKNLGQNYTELDNAAHEATHQAWEGLEQELSVARNAYQNGVVNAVKNLETIEAARQAVHGSFLDQIQNFRNTMTEYCAKYPQYDYAPIQSAIDNMLNSPNVMNGMVDGMINSVKAGQTLQQAVVTAYAPVTANIATIPNEIRLSIEPLLSTAVLTAYMDRQQKDYKKVQRDTEVYSIYKGVLKRRDERRKLEEEIRENEEWQKQWDAENPEEAQGRSR